MLKISRKIEYALIALKHMASRPEGKLTTTREICNLYKTPFDTTAKVLQILNNNDVVTSIQGVKGGYQLAKTLNEINYQSLELMIEGKVATVNCLLDPSQCEQYDVCNIHSPLQNLERKINEFLTGLTLDELLMRGSSLKAEVKNFNQVNHHE